MSNFGKYRAIVSNVSDPEKRGRIKVSCPKIYGDFESPWCLPCVPYPFRLEATSISTAVSPATSSGTSTATNTVSSPATSTATSTGTDVDGEPVDIDTQVNTNVNTSVSTNVSTNVTTDVTTTVTTITTIEIIKPYPIVGNSVWVEFEEGNVDYPIWVGQWEVDLE